MIPTAVSIETEEIIIVVADDKETIPIAPVVPVEVINAPAELQSTLLVGEVAAVGELLLPKAGVVVVTPYRELVIKLYVAAVVLRIPKT